MSKHLNMLTIDEALSFMYAFERLSTSDRKIILYLLEKDDHKYTGTNISLAEDMRLKESYNSQIARTIKKLELFGLVNVHSYTKGYTRTIELSPLWIERLITAGETIRK